MSMYGQKGRELLLELKRSDWLSPYNDELVRSCLQEISLHFQELEDQVNAAASNSSQGKPPMEARPSLLLHDAAIRRNKRCLLAYHVARLKLLEQHVNNSGSANFSSIQPLMNESEVDFMGEYEKLRTNFGASMGLNLRSNMLPPQQEFVSVRVLAANMGTIVTESGQSVDLEQGTIHYLPRGDVEPLVRQGFLEQVDGEEEG